MRFIPFATLVASIIAIHTIGALPQLNLDATQESESVADYVDWYPVDDTADFTGTVDLGEEEEFVTYLSDEFHTDIPVELDAASSTVGGLSPRLGVDYIDITDEVLGDNEYDLVFDSLGPAVIPSSTQSSVHEQVLAQLTKYNPSDTTANEVSECPICFSCVNKGDLVFNPPCNHITCVSCAKGWFIEENKKTCSMCRARVIENPGTLNVYFSAQNFVPIPGLEFSTYLDVLSLPPGYAIIRQGYLRDSVNWRLGFKDAIGLIQLTFALITDLVDSGKTIERSLVEQCIAVISVTSGSSINNPEIYTTNTAPVLLPYPECTRPLGVLEIDEQIFKEVLSFASRLLEPLDSDDADEYIQNVAQKYFIRDSKDLQHLVAGNLTAIVPNNQMSLVVYSQLWNHLARLDDNDYLSPFDEKGVVLLTQRTEMVAEYAFLTAAENTVNVLNKYLLDDIYSSGLLLHKSNVIHPQSGLSMQKITIDVDNFDVITDIIKVHDFMRLNSSYDGLFKKYAGGVLLPTAIVKVLQIEKPDAQGHSKKSLEVAYEPADAFEIGSSAPPLRGAGIISFKLLLQQLHQLLLKQVYYYIPANSPTLRGKDTIFFPLIPGRLNSDYVAIQHNLVVRAAVTRTREQLVLTCFMIQYLKIRGYDKAELDMQSLYRDILLSQSENYASLNSYATLVSLVHTVAEVDFIKYLYFDRFSSHRLYAALTHPAWDAMVGEYMRLV